MNRREAMNGLGLGVGGAALAAASPAQSKAVSKTPMLPKPILGPRMNFAQADKIMTQLGLDALVLGGGVNLYHATGLDLTSPRMGHSPGVYAIVTRNEKQRLAIVAQSFLYYYTIALDHRSQDYPAYIFTAPEPNGAMNGDEPAAQKVELFPDRGEAPLDAVETERAATVAKATARQAPHADMVLALRKALKDAGVTKGRIATDMLPVSKTTALAAPEASLVDADDALRRIRPVKSAVEIELMRQAATNNAEAAKEAVRLVRAGADVRDLRAQYFASVAMRGMRGVFMVIDRVSSPTYEAKLHDGQCFSIDCVSDYMGYHGDYARAVFVGEPSAFMKRVTDATGKAWDHIRENLKPGLKFSEVRALGKKFLKDSNIDFTISFTPHSVGLYHSDHVGSMGSPPREDVVLEPGMVLSVDCPMLEAGMGGSSHLEDLTLITKDGFENLNDIGSKIIMV